MNSIKKEKLKTNVTYYGVKKGKNLMHEKDLK